MLGWVPSHQEPPGCRRNAGGLPRVACLLATHLNDTVAARADAEAEELANLRRLLCIPADTYREIELATKGRIFQVQQTFRCPASCTGQCAV